MPRLMVVSLSVVVLTVLHVLADVAAAQAQAASAPAEGPAKAAATAAPPSAPAATAAARPAATPTMESSDAAPPAGGELDPGSYGVRLRDLEHGVNELKEQIFRSKARLSLLAETVLQGVVGGSQARVVHDNRIGDSYKIVRIAYALDGVPLLQKSDEAGALPSREPFDIFNGSIAPGEHTLSVELELRGHGFGVFSYLNAYHFKLTSNHTFNAVAGKLSSVRVVSYEQGGPTTAFERRPAVHYVENVAKPAEAPEVKAGGR